MSEGRYQINREEIGPLIMAQSSETTLPSKVKKSHPGTRRMKEDEVRNYHSTMVEHCRRMADFDSKFAVLE